MQTGLGRAFKIGHYGRKSGRRKNGGVSRGNWAFKPKNDRLLTTRWWPIYKKPTV